MSGPIAARLGGDGFGNGSPDEPASLTWTHEWFGVFPELTGKFHFEGLERCARVQLISYDATGAEMTPRDYSDTECPGDLGHNARVIVDEDGNGDLGGRAGAAEVKVTLQTQNADLSWTNAGSQTVTYGPVLDTDEVQILRADADLGAGDFDPPSPEGPATVTELNTIPVLMNAFFHNEVAEITYALEKKGGTGIWETVGMATVELGRRLRLP